MPDSRIFHNDYEPTSIRYWTAIQTDDFTALNEGVATGSAQHTRNRKSLTDATKKLKADPTLADATKSGVVTGQVKALASANQAIIDGNAKVDTNAKVRKPSTLTGAGRERDTGRGTGGPGAAGLQGGD